jgi:hypothetical protein|tara:strand:- start:15 stop:125 length:111 start_codon:yes stop_codon:yes gene_type:complete
MNKEKKEVAKYFTVLGIAIGFCLGGMFIICLQAFTV